MFGDNPDISDANEPGPPPSFVLLFEIVGFAEVLQHTPLAVTGDPPSAVTVPPHEPVDVPVAEGTAVFTEGRTGLVLNDTS